MWNGDSKRETRGRSAEGDGEKRGPELKSGRADCRWRRQIRRVARCRGNSGTRPGMTPTRTMRAVPPPPTRQDEKRYKPGDRVRRSRQRKWRTSRLTTTGLMAAACKPLVHSLALAIPYGAADGSSTWTRSFGVRPFVGPRRSGARAGRDPSNQGMVFAFRTQLRAWRAQVNIGGTVIVPETGCEELNRLPTRVDAQDNERRRDNQGMSSDRDTRSP